MATPVSYSASRFAEPVSFYTEGSNTHVVLTIHDYDEGVTIPVRIAKSDLEKMASAGPSYDSGILQNPTPDDQRRTT